VQRDFLEIWLMPNYTTHSSLSEEHIERLENELKLKIKLTFVSWSKALKELYTSFKNDNPPDVFQMGTTWITTMSHMGYIEKVPDYFKQKQFLANWIIEDSIHNGIMMAVPWLVESGMIIARKDITKELGITSSDIRTLEGFRNVCDNIYNAHVQSKDIIPLPYAFSLRNEPGKLHHLIPWFWTSGFEIPDLFNMPEVPFNIKHIEPSFEYIRSLFVTSHFSKEDASTHRNIVNDWFYRDGKYVFTIDHWYNVILGIVNESKTNVSTNYLWEIFEMPSGIHGPTPKGSGSMLGVSSISEHKEKAWHAIEYLTSETYMADRTNLCGELPSFQNNFWKTYSDHPQISSILKQIKLAKTYPKHPLWTSFERVLNDGLTKLLWYYIYEEKSLNDMSYIIEGMNIKFRELSSLAWELTINER